MTMVKNFDFMEALGAYDDINGKSGVKLKREEKLKA